jgi:hypothetical protein
MRFERYSNSDHHSQWCKHADYQRYLTENARWYLHWSRSERCRRRLLIHYHTRLSHRYQRSRRKQLSTSRWQGNRQECSRRLIQSSRSRKLGRRPDCSRQKLLRHWSDCGMMAFIEVVYDETSFCFSNVTANCIDKKDTILVISNGLGSLSRHKANTRYWLIVICTFFFRTRVLVVVGTWVLTWVSLVTSWTGIDASCSIRRNNFRSSWGKRKQYFFCPDNQSRCFGYRNRTHMSDFYLVLSLARYQETVINS